MSADTWLGAAGCASGSHTCSGTRPALEPNPRSASEEHGVARGGEQRRRGARGGPRSEVVAAPPARSRKAASRKRQSAVRHGRGTRGPPGPSPARSDSVMHQEVGRDRHRLPERAGTSSRCRRAATRLMASRNRFSIAPSQPQRVAALVGRGVAGAVERRWHGHDARRARGRRRPGASRRKARPPAIERSAGDVEREAARRWRASEAQRRAPRPRPRSPPPRSGARAAAAMSARAAAPRRPTRSRPPWRGTGQGHDAYARRGQARARRGCRAGCRAGSGGQPSTNASTGMIRSTLPADRVAALEDAAGPRAIADRDHQLRRRAWPRTSCGAAPPCCA